MSARHAAFLLACLLTISSQAISARTPAGTRCATPFLPEPVASPKPAPLQQPAAPFKVGDPLTVRAFDFRLVGGGHYQTTTTCRLVGQHCYIFVEDDVWGTPRVPPAGLDSLARAFDRATARHPDRGIFAVDTDLFGPPPDVDGDPRILIVILDILDSPITGSTFLGYFDTENQAPPISREIVYIDCSPLDITSPLARATLAHEFQHVLHWRTDPDEDKWLDEGCSEYAELACGYRDTSRTAGAFFLDLPNTSLTQWEDEAFDFDQAFLLMTYFVERYGEPALRALAADPGNGILSVNRTLEALGFSDRFEDLFAAWTAAVYLDGPGLLGYRSLDLGPVRRDTIQVPVQDQSRRVRLWGTDYLDLGPAEGLSIDIGGLEDNALLLTLITRRDDGPAAAAFSIPPGARRRIHTLGPDHRTLAVSRTAGAAETYTFTLAHLDGASPAASDFDASGRVDFADFLQFVAHFGRASNTPGFDPTCDLDGNRRVDFADFLIFARNFGAQSGASVH